MKFEPSDYLNELNFELDDQQEYNLSYEESNSGDKDLDLFSGTYFYNLDDFNSKSKRSEYMGQLMSNNDSNREGVSYNVGEQKLETSPSDAIDPALAAADNNYNSGSPTGSVSSVSTPKVSELNAGEYRRKRNTAASARFRIKKKLKEQQMEARSKELEEKVDNLEKKIMTLEMENKCLKTLILKKNEESSVNLLDSIKKRSIHDSKPLFEYTT